MSDIALTVSLLALVAVLGLWISAVTTPLNTTIRTAKPLSLSPETRSEEKKPGPT